MVRDRAARRARRRPRPMSSAPRATALKSARPSIWRSRPSAAFAAFGNIGGWWDAQHTYSGDSSNLRLTLTPGGCFCERFPDGGGIEHMRVTFVEPGKHLILTGTLGPLLYEATTGVLDVQIKPVAGGSQVTLDYRAAGFAKGGADKLAPGVDAVLATS